MEKERGNVAGMCVCVCSNLGEKRAENCVSNLRKVKMEYYAFRR